MEKSKSSPHTRSNSISIGAIDNIDTVGEATTIRDGAQTRTVADYDNHVSDCNSSSQIPKTEPTSSDSARGSNGSSSSVGSLHQVQGTWRANLRRRIGHEYFLSQRQPLRFDPIEYIQHRNLSSYQPVQLINEWHRWITALSFSNNKSVASAARNAGMMMTHKQVKDWYIGRVLDRHQLDFLEAATRELKGAMVEIKSATKKRQVMRKRKCANVQQLNDDDVIGEGTDKDTSIAFVIAQAPSDVAPPRLRTVYTTEAS
ncbi:hypothetical protein BG000_003856 [Podila horticola]|nr:hypothetical protein BG000_003856 [Podila horticola]